MIAEKKAYFTRHTIRNAYTRKDNGKTIPERYGLEFIDAGTHEMQSFIVAELPKWVDERPEDGLLEGTLSLGIEADPYSQQTNAYRAQFSAFEDRMPVSLA